MTISFYLFSFFLVDLIFGIWFVRCGCCGLCREGPSPLHGYFMFISRGYIYNRTITDWAVGNDCSFRTAWDNWIKDSVSRYYVSTMYIICWLSW